jgi:excisionase family DNA binding protein
MLRISKALAYKLIMEGEIPSVKFGRTVRVKSQDLNAFIEAKSSNGPGENAGRIFQSNAQ